MDYVFQEFFGFPIGETRIPLQAFWDFTRASKRIVRMARPERPVRLQKAVSRDENSFRVSQVRFKAIGLADLSTWENQQTVGDATTIGLNLTTRKRNLRSALLLWHMKIEQINTNKI